MTTDKAETERAMAFALDELIRHGGSARDVENLRQQFADRIRDEKTEPDAGAIPD